MSLIFSTVLNSFHSSAFSSLHFWVSVLVERRRSSPDSISDFGRLLLLESNHLTQVFRAFSSCQYFDFCVVDLNFFSCVRALVAKNPRLPWMDPESTLFQYHLLRAKKGGDGTSQEPTELEARVARRCCHPLWPQRCSGPVVEEVDSSAGELGADTADVAMPATDPDGLTTFQQALRRSKRMKVRKRPRGNKLRKSKLLRIPWTMARFSHLVGEGGGKTPHEQLGHMVYSLQRELVNKMWLLALERLMLDEVRQRLYHEQLKAALLHQMSWAFEG